MKISSAAFAFVLWLASTAAFAATPAETAKDPAPELDPKLCAQMVTYQPAGGLNGADYKPGVDVHGTPVVEADLNKSPVRAPQQVSFDVPVNVARYAHLDVPASAGYPTSVGKVVVTMDGHLTFNGQPMEGDAEAALRALCAPKPAPAKDSSPSPAGNDNKHNQ